MLGTGMTLAGVFGAWWLADRISPVGKSRALATIVRIMAMIGIALLVVGRFIPTLLN